VLEQALERWPNDPALRHLYIHAVEASSNPARALPAANRLRNAMPGAGHLVHMPTHIDVLLGDYDTVIKTNQRAIAVDNQFLEREGAMNFYTLYRVHCYHFVVYGAMLAGQRETALTAARQLVQQVPEQLLRAQTDFLDSFMGTPYHAQVRFGDWEGILREPEPAEYLPVTRSLRHYARGLAFAATGRVAEAEAEQQAFLRQRDAVPETSMQFNNRSLDILAVAEVMLAGEIAYRRGEYERAFELLREAVRRDDSLNYDEPWGWMQPARHALGALLLEQGQLQEAEAVYREDLRRRPHNVWALRGLTEALVRQGKSKEAAGLAAELGAAAKLADIPIDRSCFCRTGPIPKTP
jgi:tetratricopeptide (TPR) repeat protein